MGEPKPKCGEPGCCPSNPVDGGIKPMEGDHPFCAKLRSALNATHVEVVDQSDGCGQKLQLVVVSDEFDGKPLLAQHRLVNKALEDELKSVHAFNIKTMTPAKWAKRQQQPS